MAKAQLQFSPFVFIAVQRSLIGLLIAFTSPTSFLRPWLFLILALCNYILLPSYSFYIPRSTWIAIASGEALFELLGYVEQVLLDQWSFGHRGPRKQAMALKKVKHNEYDRPLSKSEDTTGDTIWERLKFATWAAFSARHIATPYQVRNVSPYSKNSPSFVPTRTAFLLKTASVVLICYLALDVLESGNEPGKYPAIYADKYVPIFTRRGEFTMEEFIVRIMTSVLFWTGGYMAIQVVYGTLVFISVASGIDRPELCRPNFGSFSEAYTIRGFWGVFWHQFLRERLTKSARYITFHLLHLPRTTATTSLPLRLLARHTEIFFVFFISGVFHTGIEVAQGMVWTESGATTFFVMMATAIIIEDGAQWVSFDLLMGNEARKKWWTKAIGYVWVLMVFTYVTPFYAYPALRQNTGGKRYESLPFSVFGLLKAMSVRAVQLKETVR